LRYITVKQASGKTNNWIKIVPRNYHLLVVAIIFVLLVIVHYHEAFSNIWILERIGSFLELGLTRQTFGRILFLIPITYGALVAGIGAGISILGLSLAAMLPRVFIISTSPKEALFETAGIVFTGLLIILLIEALNKARQHLIELGTTHKMLDLQIERLSMLHAMSNSVSQSLKLEDILATVDIARKLIQIDTSWLYLWDEEKRYLKLAVYKGIPGQILPETISQGEGPEGKAAKSREPAIIENIAADSSELSLAWKHGDLQSMLVVPIIAKGELVGTVGVGSLQERRFSQDEVDLLQAISDQLGMAVENARLYKKEQASAEALRASEKNYRELFESASDAIWVHDLDGKIIAVNSAFEKLTGYERDTLLNANVSIFLSTDGREKIDQEAHDVVLRGGIAGPNEQELYRRDGSIVIIQIGTSLITKDGRPWAFQHIARDITENKKVQENLKLYVQKVSQAQEAERKRIARELHDVTAQALVTVVRNLGDVDSGRAQFSLKEIQEQVREILGEIRRFSRQLRPSILDDLGLLPALKWLAADLTNNYGIPVDVQVIGEPRQLSNDAELMLFRITQEALTNVQKHSGADQVRITIEFTERATKVTVNDNGKGFEIPERMGDLAGSGRLGLAGMQERAQLLGGILNIDSESGKGTTLTIEIPV
jgi:PAS domain S-box-containing protein